jgi:alpha-L-fucosidase
MRCHHARIHFRQFVFIAVGLIVFVYGVSLRAADEPAQNGAVAESAPEKAGDVWQREYGPSHDQRMQWWREARFGMFIHWGVYSVPAGEWKGQQTKFIGEWLMHTYKIPVDEYIDKIQEPVLPTFAARRTGLRAGAARRILKRE